MSDLVFRPNRPDRWTLPRMPQDASLRRMMYGPIVPMEQPGLLARLFRRR